MTANGKIECLLMKVDKGDEQKCLAVLLELLRKMPRYTRFILYCSSEESRVEAETFLRANRFRRFWVAGAGARPAQIPKCTLLTQQRTGTSVGTSWIRDTFFVKWDPAAQTAFLSETASQRLAERHLAEFLEQSADIFPNVEAGQDFQGLPLAGGNALLAGRYILAGYEETKEMDSAELEKQVKALFNYETDTPFDRVLIVGRQSSEKVQAFIESLYPFFTDATNAEREAIPRFASMFLHLDMFLTVTGITGAGQKPVLFLARAAGLCTLGSPTGSASAILTTWNDYMDAIALELEPYFEVRRNDIPLFIRYRSINKENKGILSSRPIGIFPGAYNNCLVEVNNRTRRVWLPKISYASRYAVHQKWLNNLEKENQALWEQLDFTVSWIEADFYNLSLGYSGLHCITKELARG